jgi:hypothetical protein
MVDPHSGKPLFWMCPEHKEMFAAALFEEEHPNGLSEEESW